MVSTARCALTTTGCVGAWVCGLCAKSLPPYSPPSPIARTPMISKIGTHTIRYEAAPVAVRATDD
jgi:hypothetical protein